MGLAAQPGPGRWNPLAGKTSVEAAGFVHVGS